MCWWWAQKNGPDKKKDDDNKDDNDEDGDDEDGDDEDGDDDDGDDEDGDDEDGDDDDGDKKDCELIREMLKGNGVAGGDEAQKWRWSGKPASSQVPQPTFMLVGEPD